eukprot:comp6047_c0_seq1/m.1883 comp6047_c0_seq1/g.1883  ORF comp6047_c0_seq1/g.1883 comp6047_c0_seq1/m.1883 type:complete len:309 (-) comp6047_c0_seq1:130-1056(-)
MPISTYSSGRPQDDDSLAHLFDSDEEDLPPELKNAPSSGPAGRQSEQRQEEHSDVSGESGPEEAQEDGKKKKAAAKKPSNSKRPRLDENLLMSENGVKLLYRTVSQFKFKGEGHEGEDLRQLLRCYEIWAHRLYPAYTLKDFAAAVQRRSGNRALRNFLDRLSMELRPKSEDVDVGVSEFIVDDEGANSNSDGEWNERPRKEHSQNKEAPAPVRKSVNPTEEEMDEIMRDMDTHQNSSNFQQKPPPPQPAPPVPAPAPLSPGTLERMRINREKALQKRLERQRQEEERRRREAQNADAGVAEGVEMQA